MSLQWFQYCVLMWPQCVSNGLPTLIVCAIATIVGDCGMYVCVAMADVVSRHAYRIGT